jgi:hypothetical protein
MRYRALAVLLVALLVATSALADVTFNSTTDRLTVANFVVPTPAGTTCTWFFPNWAQTDGVDHQFWGLSDGASSGFFAFKDSSNNLVAGWLTSGTLYRVLVASGSYTINTSAWNALCETYDDTANEVKLYLNNAQIGSTQTSLVTWATNHTLHLGNHNTANFNLDGRLAHTAFWSSVLSSTSRTRYFAGQFTTATIASCLGAPSFYWPLPSISDLTDYADGKNLTNANVTDGSGAPTTSGCQVSGSMLLIGVGP